MRIFLSFNSKDEAIAAILRAMLQKLDPDVDIFFAPVTTLGQGFWLPKLAEEIDKRDAFLLLLGPRGVGPWQEIEYHEAFGKHVDDSSFALVPVIVGPSPVPGLPFLRRLNWVEIPEAFDDKAVLRILAALNGKAGPTVSPLWKLVQPYRGLEAMTEANADYFYGRANETKAVLGILTDRPSRLPILIGASGVGKSSVARAGVLSALKTMRWPGQVDADTGPTQWPEALRNSRTGWVWLVMRPGDDPLHALASSFTRLWLDDPTHPDRGPLARAWAEGLRGRNTLSDLIEATRDKLEARDGVRPDRILLYVDQGEELYTGAGRTAPKDARRFSEVLAEGIKNPFLSAFASMRADYYDRLQADTHLFSVQELVNVPPLGRAALAEVVTGPAKALGVGFEDDHMADRIVDATTGARGSLPLLSYLMTDVWSEMVKRGDGSLRLPVRAIDVGGVLAATAEKFLQANPAAERWLRRLLTLKLTFVPSEGDPLRRQARRSECAVEEWSLAEQLAEYPWRLVVMGERDKEEDGGTEVTAEVTHETLLRAWPKLVNWLRDEREFLVFKGDAERAERRWRGMHSPDRALFSGLDLDRAIDWVPKRSEDLSSEVRDFIQGSISADRKNKEKQLHFQRQVSMGAAAAALILAFASILAVWGWLEAKSKQLQAEAARKEAQVSFWVATARSDLRDGRVTSAVRYAILAFEELPTETSRSALISSLLEVSPHLQATFDVATDGAAAMAWTDLGLLAFAPVKAGKKLRTVSMNQSTEATGTSPEWPIPGLTREVDGNVAAIRAMRAIGPDRILAVLDNGKLAWIDRGATAPRVFLTPSRPTTLYSAGDAAAIGTSGSLIATANNGGAVAIIKCARSGSEPMTDCHESFLNDARGRVVAVSPDETRIAVGDEAGAVFVYDREGTRLGEPISIGASLLSLGWAKARDLLAVGTADGEIVVIDIRTPAQPKISRTSLGGTPITMVAWNPKGLELAFICERKNICLWPVGVDENGITNFAPIRRFSGHSEVVTHLSWSPTGERIASASLDNSIRIWSLVQNTDAGSRLYAESPAQLVRVATARDGRWIAGGAKNGTIRIWEVGSRALSRTSKSSYDSEVAALAWAQSGLLAAAHESEGITLVPMDDKLPTRQVAFNTDLDTRIVFAEDDKTIAVPQHSDKKIALIDVEGTHAPRYLDPIGPDQVPWGLAVSPSGRTLFASYTDTNGEIRMWDLVSLKQVGPMAYTLLENKDSSAAGSIAVDSNGRRLAISGGDRFVRLYDIAKKQSLFALPMSLGTDAPWNVAFSPDGNKLAVLGSQNRVDIWSLREEGADLYATFNAFPERAAIVDSREQNASALDWLTNDNVVIATGNSAIHVIGLDPVKWRRRIGGLIPRAASPLN
jgi:WD40 repeat protein